MTLKCSSRLNPVGEFQWFFNGKLVQSDEAKRQDLKNLVNDDSEYQQSILVLTNTNTKNAGRYKCLVRNEVGAAEHTILLENSSKASFVAV